MDKIQQQVLGKKTKIESALRAATKRGNITKLQLINNNKEMMREMKKLAEHNTNFDNIHNPQKSRNNLTIIYTMTDKSYIDNSLFLIDFKISETIQRNTNNIEDATIESLASITPIDDYKLKKKQKVLYNNNKDRYFLSKILNNSIIKYNKISFTTNEQSQESELKKSKTWEYKYEDAVIEYIFHDFYYKLKNDNDNLYNLYNTFFTGNV